LLGTVYPHGRWTYFPVAFAIKTTLGLLILLALVPLSLARLRTDRPGDNDWRELLFLIVPAAIYFLVAMGSGMNIGVRHILPVYPFLMILAAWGAWQLIQRQRRWAYVVALLLLWNAVSSVRTFPVYLAYSNELWGGPSQTYKYLSDSNADWGQQLWATQKYLDGRQLKSCWFAYFAQVVVDPTYYGVPCKPLTTIASVWLQPSIEVPASVDGPVLVSAGVLSGYEFGPGELNPYDQFQRLQPTAVIEDGLFVFDGHFEIPLAAALNHVTRAQLAVQANHLEEALSEAQAAVALAPRSVQAEAELGDVLRRLQRPDESRQAFQKALVSAQTIHPEFQSGWLPGLKKVALEGR
jgi:tetratricopeptide (TPR) repeat protein